MFAASNYKGPGKGRIMVSSKSEPGHTYGVISKRHTALSADTFAYKGHTSFGGINPKEVLTAFRGWSSVSEPPLALSNIIDLLVPNEFLVNKQLNDPGDGATPDAKVGCDFYNVPRDLIIGARRAKTLSTATDESVYLKVNNAKHKFVFTNYSRFPKMIHIQHLVGPVTDQMVSNPTVSGTTRSDFTFASSNEYPDQWSNLDSYVLPGARNAGEAGEKVYIDIDCPFNDMFGPEYSKSPAASEFTYPANGGWLEVNGQYLEDGAIESGETYPFFDTNPFQSTVTNPYSYKVKMFVSSMEPHGDLIQGDGGVAVDSGTDLTYQGSNSLKSKGINIELYSRWDTTIKFVGENVGEKHYGDEARIPDMVAS
ncbi:hypothetical protein [Circoviridae 10 LDMD-2013]|uniref:hypothetical protein n=1 Tax=Circoviridae 10 LDMD-2013 TaxID=1379714 RepID=UPI00038460C1|nr:hypothetical protein [Circoviridae 10 LDMD-2013]AGS36209.1 hypothetical protein [Circoviridae 10 LDMD-2013]